MLPADALALECAGPDHAHAGAACLAAAQHPTRPAAVRMAAPVAVQAAAEQVDLARSSTASNADAAITVAGWNVGLDDADVGTISARIGALDGVDLWGLAEVNNPDAVDDLKLLPQSASRATSPP